MASTAIITGASRGLGLALARALAARRWRLDIDARGAPPLVAARRELAALTDVTALVGDVGVPRQLGRRVLQRSGLAGVDDQAPAPLGERPGERQAESAGGSGDDGVGHGLEARREAVPTSTGNWS